MDFFFCFPVFYWLCVVKLVLLGILVCLCGLDAWLVYIVYISSLLVLDGVCCYGISFCADVWELCWLRVLKCFIVLGWYVGCCESLSCGIARCVFSGLLGWFTL